MLIFVFYFLVVKVFERQFIESAETSSSIASFLEKSDESESVLYGGRDLANFPMNFNVNVNDIFIRKADLVTAMKVIAMRNNFQFKVERSSQTRYSIVCMNSDCAWNMIASVCSQSKIWVIRSYVNAHNCFGNNTQVQNRQVSSSLVGQCVKQDLSGALGNSLTPLGVVDIMRTRFKVEISYFKAWKGRTKALTEIRGKFEESYSHLPIIGEMIRQKNPGTVAICVYLFVLFSVYLGLYMYINLFLTNFSGSFTETVNDDNGNFKYFFLAVSASIRGWNFCRPVISVDGTFLKGKYHGTLLLATAHDGDNHLFPLAFGIVDSENDKSWLWFMERVRYAYGVREDLVIISDRNSSIPKAVHRVFPEAKYAVCMQHLWANVKSKFGKSYIQPMFYRCAKAYTIKDFDYWLDVLSKDKPAIKKYLLDARLELWSRAHFQGRRHGLMTTNISESMNAVLNVARGWPVAALLLSWRCLLQKWFNDRRGLIPKMVNGITAHALKLLEEVESDARSMNVS